MRYPTTKDIYRTWLRLKGDRKAPDRQDLNPAELGPHLGDILLLERTGDEIRFRIAGARVCALMGGELRGKRFIELFSHYSSDDMTEVIGAVEQDMSPVIIGISAHFPDRISMEGEMILLPFTHDRGGSGETRILGALCTRSLRLAALPPCVELDILSFRVIAEGDASRLIAGDFQIPAGIGDRNLDAFARRRARFQLLEGGLR